MQLESMAVLLRPRDWTVPRRGMCTAFWCGVILIFTSIILLVTSRHKGRLYQSWGSVFLGCGCCLLLICLILCIHAYFVMSNSTRQLHSNRTAPNHDSYFDMSLTCYDATNQMEFKTLLSSSMPAGVSCSNKSQLDKLLWLDAANGQFNDKIIDVTSAKCLETPPVDNMKDSQVAMDTASKPSFIQSDGSDAQPPDYHEVMTSSCRLESPCQTISNKQPGIANDMSPICRVKPVVAPSVYCTHSLPISNHLSQRNAIAVGQSEQVHIPLDLDCANASHLGQQVTSLPRQFRHRDVVPSAGPVTRTFGHTGVITVTPLTARKIRTTAPAADAAIAVNATVDSECHIWRKDVTVLGDYETNLGDQTVESKATVYDNVLNI